ncbi:LacI family DNA-binding transcriptional regulator [Furfurilactobacillus cerevisiae]|uniref:LacI family DNA-binding transcriptional regulator n=1 Tax=Furfurilactobacillus rossiae TaxID=231049 RepID=UPI003B97DF88
MRVTIKDVAQAANVSVSTVSRVLSNKENFFASKTADHVRKVAADLGYQRNAYAADLASHQSDVLAVVISATKSNFADEIITGIHDVATKHGNSVMILYAGENNPTLQDKAIKTVIERDVMGVLIVALELGDESLNSLKTSGIPHIFLSTAAKENLGPFIASDDHAIGYEATKYLIEHGHRKIGLVGMDEQSFVGTQRMNGYREAMAEHGLSINEDWLVPGYFTFEDGEAAMQHFGKQPAVTAIIANSDLTAIGVIDQARDYGLEVPAQLSVMSIDGTKLTRIFRPTITSVTQDFFQIGRAGCAALLTGDNEPIQSKFLPIKIVERNSTRQF